MHNNENLQHAEDLIANSDALVIAAGAGMGVDSGMPDLRRIGGLWTQTFNINGKATDLMELASPETFATDAQLAWGFYGERLAMCRQTQPHAGFTLLKQWAASKPLGAWVFTSNIDGQFQIAGFPAESVEECHCPPHELQCVKPCEEAVWSATDFTPEVDKASLRLHNTCTCAAIFVAAWRGPMC